MKENLKLRMWSPSSIDFENIDVVLNHQKIMKSTPNFQPNPYTFTKLENGKKIVADATSFTPPSWLLLDHSIAVIWSLFSLDSPMKNLSIDDLKWTYEFLKEIKNKKGENPPDVKVCLREIQDRLIDLYAKLTSLKYEDFSEIAAVFGDKIIQGSSDSYINASYIEKRVESKLDELSTSEKNSSTLMQEYHSSKDISKSQSTKALFNSSKKPSLLLENDPNFYDDKATNDEEEVEKYVLSLLEDNKKDILQPKLSAKSLIPTKKRMSASHSEVVSSQDSSDEATKKEKTSKRVHCVAEMRSLKFQKSTKVTDTNGEEAAYSNLKAEIQRLTINPDVSRSEVMKFLKDWRSEQVKKLHNELKKLGNIEEERTTMGEVDS